MTQEEFNEYKMQMQQKKLEKQLKDEIEKEQFSQLSQQLAPISLSLGAAGATLGLAGSLSELYKPEKPIRSGDITSNVGMMGVKKPFVRITRHRTITPSTLAETEGLATRHTAKVGSLSGFTKFREVHIENISCTKDEAQEIERILKEGIIL